MDTLWVQKLGRADFLRSAGLYVTQDRMALAGLRKDFFRVSVVAEDVKELARPGGPAARRQMWTEAIRSLLPQLQSRRDPLYVCFSPDYAVSCQVSLPLAAEDNLVEVLGYEVERLVPFAREEVYFDFMPFRRRGEKLEVLIFAARREAVDELIDVLATFGIKPQGVEVSVTAVVNYLWFCAEELPRPAVVLGSQGRTWELVGLDAGRNGWGRKPAVLFASWWPKGEWTAAPGVEMTHELLRDAPQLFTWGSVEDFPLPVRGGPLNPVDLLALGKKRFGGRRGVKEPLAIPAVGAALRGLGESALALNLVPAREKRPSPLSRLNAALGVLLLVALAVWGAGYPIRDEIRLRRLKEEITKLQPAVESLKREEADLQRVGGEAAVLSRVTARRGEVLGILEELSRLIPANAYLTGLRYRLDSVELQGSAESTSNLIPLLERSPLLKNVGFNAPSNRGRDNRESFSIKAEVERP